MLNRTRVGMMIRAGVDDRAMLSATGVNVHVVFAIVFALGAGLAGFAGVVGGSALSVAPGEDVRYLLASLVVVIVGGMGSITGAAIGALLIGLAEQIGLVYFPTYGIVLTFVIMVAVLAIRPQGIMGKAAMSAVTAATAGADRAQPGSRPSASPHIVLAALLIVYPLVGSNFFLTQIGAYSLILGMIALSLMLLAGYGGMVSLAQITRRRHRRLCGRDLRASTIPACTASAGRCGWWCRSRSLIAAVASALIGWISVRTAGIYTIMITLAIATAFFYFAQQNYSLFNGYSGFAGIARAGILGRQLARLRCRSTISAWRARRSPMSPCSTSSRSTFGLALQAIRDNPRRMRALGFDVTAHKVAA